ncbi:MAG: hypothetical protein PHU08_00175 [Dehalococcoidales bacterium]|nr:hypothetical protein [Dehalococcoidales bacterium]
MTFSGDFDALIDPILIAFRRQIRLNIASHLVRAYLQADAQMVSWGRTKLGLPILYEGPPIQRAIDWAQDHCAKLVTKMDEETKTRLAKVISDGINNKRGIDGLTRDIRKEFADMSRTRAELIAKTETRQALTHAAQERMEDLGVTGKEWVLGSGGEGGNCDDCRRNASVGVIPVTSDFPIPQDEIHPGCTCAVAPAMLPR